MPNHFHIVMSPSKTCGTAKFIAQVKNLTQKRIWERAQVGFIFIDRYWDKVVRPTQELEHLIRYVLYNPVRKGLSTTWDEYPYSGPRNAATLEIANRSVEISPTSHRIERDEATVELPRRTTPR